MSFLDRAPTDNGVEARIRSDENAQSFDLDAEHKGDPVRLTGTIYNQFSGFDQSSKGNLHNHALAHRWDDDSRNAQVHYAKKGYDFIAGMDHDEVVDIPEHPDIVTVPGMELSINAGDLLTFGLDEYTFPEADDPVEEDVERIRSIHERGGVAVLAHPNKTAYTWDQLQKFCDAGLTGLEIVNSGVTGKTADSGKFDQCWKLLLQDGRYLIGLANDDAHGPHTDAAEWGGVSQLGWTGLFTDDLSPTGIVEAMRHGRTYASHGPRIHSIEFVPEEGSLQIECSEAVACHFQGLGSYGGDSAIPNDGSTATSFSLDFIERGYRIRDYITVIVEDKHGRRAWTTPIPTDLTETAR